MLPISLLVKCITRRLAMSCPSTRPVRVPAHCRPLPKRRPRQQFNEFVLENACKEQMKATIRKEHHYGN